MNKEESIRIYQAILMFFDGDTKNYIQEHLKLSFEEIELASNFFRELKFFNRIKNE